jgi:hypothetical protein
MGVLVIGRILTTGKRTLSAVLRVKELSQKKTHARYHHVDSGIPRVEVE